MYKAFKVSIDLDGNRIDERAKTICASLAVPKTSARAAEPTKNADGSASTERRNAPGRQPGRVDRWGSPASAA